MSSAVCGEHVIGGRDWKRGDDGKWSDRSLDTHVLVFSLSALLLHYFFWNLSISLNNKHVHLYITLPSYFINICLIFITVLWGGLCYHLSYFPAWTLQYRVNGWAGTWTPNSSAVASALLATRLFCLSVGTAFSLRNTLVRALKVELCFVKFVSVMKLLSFNPALKYLLWLI